MTETNDQDWRWLRVYYFERSKDPLILDAIWPLLERIARGRSEAMGFFQRDWVGGPNVIVGMKQASPDMQPYLDAAAAVLRDYLRVHPSTTTLDRREFQTQMKSVALRELRPGLADADVQPNNTVLSDCGEPIAPLLRDQSLKDEERSFLSRSTPIVVRWLRLVQDGISDRGLIAMRALITAAWVASPERLTAAASFYAHAQGFLRHADPQRRLSAQFATRYEDGGGETVRRVAGVTLDALRSSREPVPGLLDFAELVRNTLVRLRGALEARAFTPYSFEELAPTITFSANPRTAEAQRRLFVLLNESPILRAWQITVNLVYLALNQLGVKPLQRFLACYLVARAMEDMFGLHAEELGHEVAYTGDVELMVPFFAGN
jgi:hypothetical protein